MKNDVLNDVSIQTIIATLAVVISFFSIYEFRSWINLEYKSAIENAEVLFEKNEYEKAKDKFLLALNEKPNDTYCLNMLEKCNHKIKIEENEKIASKYFLENNFEYALSYYEHLSDLDPENSYFTQKIDDCKARLGLINYKGLGSTEPQKRKDSSSDNLAVSKFSAPVKNLFNAWTDLDLDFYMAQWSEQSFQHSKKSIKRNYEDILKQRHSLFKRLKQVVVNNYTVYEYEIINEKEVILYINYSMDFLFHNGKKIVETDISEKYLVNYFDSMDRWLITENYDYID